ncbi:isoprenylcysteine carboxylmethyltransferase family protein [Pseudoxanthomonas gei]|uniref:methanethiol S-methyltransferase n=1 Tax=Pseudoxanthomonas gei TaxID=1383030 RepID=A0ABX0AEI6_9GAMM|nr:methanethiol S-methyltransferase [Pseudoxanthomonas gei]NDK40025.1 isoprenylcysteine carboxylmethyltransferase family protein [Pseudoxanthomonas gei]
MKRFLILLYGVVCYAVFLATFLYAIGFIGNLWVPKAMDSAPATAVGTAVLIDLGLLALFAIQHSVMARPAFKRAWTRIIPESAERSTYTLLSSVALILLFWLWSPIGGVVWRVENGIARALIHCAFAFGWMLLLYTTFLLNHFDLFGLRQVWLQFRRRPYTHLPFKTPSIYGWVRHPLYVGWLFTFWATPTMTVTHLLFALMTTAYILVAIQWEERDLLAALPEYADYRKRVPMLVPRRRRGARAAAAELRHLAKSVTGE